MEAESIWRSFSERGVLAFRARPVHNDCGIGLQLRSMGLASFLASCGGCGLTGMILLSRVMSGAPISWGTSHINKRRT